VTKLDERGIHAADALRRDVASVPVPEPAQLVRRARRTRIVTAVGLALVLGIGSLAVARAVDSSSSTRITSGNPPSTRHETAPPSIPSTTTPVPTAIAPTSDSGSMGERPAPNPDDQAPPASAPASTGATAVDDPGTLPSTADDPNEPAAPPTGAGSSSNGLIPAPDGLSTRIELAQTTIEAGSSEQGTLVVTNTTGAPIALIDFTSHHCTPKFSVELSNDAVPSMPFFTDDCRADPFIVQAGENRYAFTISARHRFCTNDGASGLAPRCAPDGLPALPAGEYRAVLYGSELPLPPPEPVPVTVVAPSEP